MNRLTISVATLIIGLILSPINCDLTELWSIEQLDDMILSDAFKRDAPARTPAILGLYEKPCKNRLYRELGFTDRGLPNSMHLVLATFDRKTAQTEPWYGWEPEIMDVFMRYNLTIENKQLNEWCPTIIFQPANWSLPVIYYDPNNDGRFIDWAWKMIATNIRFTYPNIENNQNDNSPIKLLFRYQDPNLNDITNEQILAIVKPGQTALLENLHAGETVVAENENGEIINRYIIDTITKQITITKSTDENIINDEKFKSKQDAAHHLRLQRDWSTRRRYLNNIKSPPLMPQFTEHGFKHSLAPKEICDYVKEFYELNKNNKRKESFPKDGTQINTREIPTYMMHIPGNKKKWIASKVKPLLEEWSQTKLKYSTMYGEREYINGAVLKGHVDRIETHIISTIIHVTHKPNNISWPLEVVSWDGKRYYIEDNDCDMIFYESSKLIHGRPSTYKGESWVNAFLHFRPDPWVGYTFTPQNKIVTPQGERDLVDFIYG